MQNSVASIDMETDPIVERLAAAADHYAVWARDIIRYPDRLKAFGIDPKKVNGAVAYRADEFNRLALRQLTKRFTSNWKGIEYSVLVWWMRADFWTLDECLAALDELGIGVTEVRRSHIRNIWKTWLNLRFSNSLKTPDLTRGQVEELYFALEQSKRNLAIVDPTTAAISKGLHKTVKQASKVKAEPNPKMRLETIDKAIEATEKRGDKKATRDLKREKHRLRKVARTKKK